MYTRCQLNFSSDVDQSICPSKVTFWLKFIAMPALYDHHNISLHLFPRHSRQRSQAQEWCIMLDAIAMHVDSTAGWWDPKRKEGACSFAVKCRFTLDRNSFESLLAIALTAQKMRDRETYHFTSHYRSFFLKMDNSNYCSTFFLCLSIPNNVRWPEPISARGRRCSNTSNSQNWEQKPHLWVLTLFLWKPTSFSWKLCCFWI